MYQFRGGINLVPPEIAESRQVRRAWMFAAGIVIGAVVILAVLTIWESSQAKRVSNRVEAQKRENAALEARARELEYLETLQSDFERQRSLVQSAWTDEVSWAKVLQEIAAVMPDGVYLTNFTGQRGPQQSVPLQGQSQQPARRGEQPGAQAQGAPLPPSSPSANRKIIGKITIQATAKTHRDVGNWLYRVNRGMPSLTAAWVKNAQLTEQQLTGGGTAGGLPLTVTKVNFTSEAFLSPYAMGWMGRCAERGFESLAQAPYGVCGHSFYGAQAPGAPAAPRRR